MDSTRQPGPLPLCSAKARWQAYNAHLCPAIHLVRNFLQQSKTLMVVQEGLTVHGEYMTRLRTGVRAAYALMIAADRQHAAVEREAEEAARMLASGLVVTEISKGQDIPMWMQADASMTSTERVAQRKELRFDRRVMAVLQQFWEAAVHSVTMDGSGDIDVPAIGPKAHAAALRRIYRLMIKDYDDADAVVNIEKDWMADTKGADMLSRRRFCDAFFELADICEGSIRSNRP